MAYYGGTIALDGAKWNDREAVERELDRNADGMEVGIWYERVRWNRNIVCATEGEAIRKLNALPDWYGILYHKAAPDTAAIKRLAAAERRTKERHRAVCAETDVHNRKSKTMTCGACGSRVELARFTGSHCPVCGESLRSAGARERVRRAYEAHKAAAERLSAARAENARKHGELAWMVSYVERY